MGPSPNLSLLLLGQCLRPGLCDLGEGSLGNVIDMLRGQVFEMSFCYAVGQLALLSLGRISVSRLHSDVDRMGRTVALNANVLVRRHRQNGPHAAVMLRLSWRLTLLTCIEMPLFAICRTIHNCVQELKDQMQDCHAQNKDLASQTIGEIRTVRSFNSRGR
ncbi:hypothetical protein INR49_006406 [Caranx melampygus]|nr:hypothetical protein INR49_006406 [Caranx melampygus]